MITTLLQLTEVPLAILAAGFGALAGAVGSFIVRHYFDYKQQSRQKRNLRLSLIAELSAIERLEPWEDVTDGDSPVPEYDFIPTTVFENNASTIGLLTSEEVRAIVDFYSAVSVITKHASSDPRSTIPQNLSDSTQSAFKNVVYSSKKHALKTEFESVNGKREVAIQKIKNNL